MKTLLILAACIVVSSAKSVTVLKSSELTDELINSPRYILYETEEGLFEVEDLETSTADVMPFAYDDSITFYVYTPENPSRGVQIRASQLRDIVALTGFNLNRETLVIIHGWRNHHESPVNDQIKNAALVSKNINVIVADWSPIAEQNYVGAQGSVLAVGNFIGDFLIRLNNELNHYLTRVTVVGHSLGAHVAGNVGARTEGLITTIIGLDPAGPLFSQNNINNRLDPTDAEYVHVIHTNDGVLGFGIKMGHADYYPNGGRTQPGCGIDLGGSCAHSRAYSYYAESLNNYNFLSRKCDSYANFQNNLCSSNTASYLGGDPIARSPTGDYYLFTNNNSPFAQG